MTSNCILAGFSHLPMYSAKLKNPTCIVYFSWFPSQQTCNVIPVVTLASWVFAAPRVCRYISNAKWHKKSTATEKIWLAGGTSRGIFWGRRTTSEAKSVRGSGLRMWQFIGFASLAFGDSEGDVMGIWLKGPTVPPQCHRLTRRWLIIP